MTFTWLFCIVATAAVTMWTISVLVPAHSYLRGLLMAITVILALGLMVAGFIYGLHYQLP